MKTKLTPEDLKDMNNLYMDYIIEVVMNKTTAPIGVAAVEFYHFRNKDVSEKPNMEEIVKFMQENYEDFLKSDEMRKVWNDLTNPIEKFGMAVKVKGPTLLERFISENDYDPKYKTLVELAREVVEVLESRSEEK